MTDAADLPHLLGYERVLHSVAGELTGRFAGVFSLETVERSVLTPTACLPPPRCPTTYRP